MGGGVKINKVAYLNKEDITGKVLLNVHAENGYIVNSTYDDINIDTNNVLVSVGIGNSDTKFNSYSMEIPGAIPIPESITGDFTFSCWAKYDSRSGNGVCLQTYPIFNRYAIGYEFNDQNSGDKQHDVYMGYLGNFEHFKYITPMKYTWMHIAITKKDKVCYIFRDGELLLSGSISDNFVTSLLANPQLSASIEYYGDDIVVIKDQCLWTENFTPPTEPLIGYNMKHNQIIWETSAYKQRFNKVKIY